jgi:curved DNA-binding protein CbpA
MEDGEDPYDVLGVSPTATDAEIRSAYRKLALRHHPDKQQQRSSGGAGSTEEDRRAATVKFAKIANAYEILSDASQRREYDRSQQWSQGQSPSAGGDGGFDPGSSYDQHHPNHFFWSSFHRAHPFHDPFEVFERVFREELGANDPRGGQQQYRHHDPRYRRQFPSAFDGFDDGFFGGPRTDPFFGGRMMGGGFPGLFGGGLFGGGGFPGFGADQGLQRSGSRRGYRDPFDEMFQSLHQQATRGGGDPRSGNYSTYSVTSSSSTFGGGHGESVTTQTTTRIVNGERQSVTERIVRKADGTVERQVLEDTNAGGQGARLTNGDPPAGTPAALPAPPARRRRSTTNSSSSRSANDPSEKRRR